MTEKSEKRQRTRELHQIQKELSSSKANRNHRNLGPDRNTGSFPAMKYSEGPHTSKVMPKKTKEKQDG